MALCGTIRTILPRRPEGQVGAAGELIADANTSGTDGLDQVVEGMMNGDWDWEMYSPSRRSPTFAANVVSTSQPLAARAGLSALERGGNAMDAALAAAITLTVVEPVMNGLGSDVMALVSSGSGIEALNGSGRSPRAWSRGLFSHDARMPTEGWNSVTVPGAVEAWFKLSERFGRLPFEELFRDAIRYASEGFYLSPVIAGQWASQVPRLKNQPGFAQAFLPSGRSPSVGERFCLPGQRETLTQISESEGRALYEGDIAKHLIEHGHQHGGLMTMEDMAQHRSEWVQPMSLRYRRLTLHEMPPNTQGLAVLVALGILQHFDLSELPLQSVERVHLQVEAMKQAFHVAQSVLADRDSMRHSVAEWIDPQRLQTMAAQIRRDRAGEPAMPRDPSGGTVYIAAADASGMVVSFIQSNFQGFGSGIVVPGTGVSLHNRGAGFSLVEDHPNVVAGGKRPLHTILPALLSRDGVVVGALGVVGANMQPQGQVQIISGMEDFGLNPQAAVDVPRWRLYEDGSLKLEYAFGQAFARELSELGHRVELRPQGDPEFGGAQLVMALEAGGFVAASDGRRDGIACGY